MKPLTSTDILRWRTLINQSRSGELDAELRELWIDTLHAEQIAAESAPVLTSVVNGLSSHCSTCKAEYKHLAHPRTGAIMISTCACKIRSFSDGKGNTIMILEPPANV